MGKLEWLKTFHQTLPRSLRRHWRYAGWNIPAYCPWSRESVYVTETLKSGYLELLEFGLRNRAKALLTNHPRRNRYVWSLYNMAQSMEFRRMAWKDALRFTSKNSDRQFHQWLDAMFLAYPLPPWSYALWNSPMNTPDRTALLRLGQGESPREVLHLSKRGNAMFRQIDVAFPTLKQNVCYLAARTRHCSREIAFTLAEALERVCHQKTWDELLHIGRVIAEWLVREKISVDKLEGLIEYWTRRKLFDLQFSLKGRSFASVRREIKDWEEQRRGYRLGQRSWALHDFSSVQEAPGVIFEELHETKALWREGRRQHNCTGEYWEECLRGNCAIVSMRSLDATVNVTIEIDLLQQSIVQALERCNQPPSALALHCLQEYAREKNLIWAA